MPRGHTLTLLIGALGLDARDAAALVRAASPPPRPRRHRAGVALVERLHNVPPIATKLIGRDDDLRALDALLKRERLVTIAGTGGIGKTQTAIAAALRCKAAFADGVRFVELAGVAAGAAVAAAVASVLDVSLSPKREANAALVASLADFELLLVLDNCEHVARDVARLADAIVRTCPGVRMLATSRAPLDAAGEVVYALPTLSLPDDDDVVSLENAARSDAVALFVERVGEHDSAFRLTHENASTIAAICRRLDGIALAIELAARRTRSLSIDDVAVRLHRRFRLLTGGPTLVARHETLTSLFAWSYELLEVGDREFFDALGIFPASFDFDAARAIGLADPHDEFAALDRLSSLIAKSLVVRLDRGTGRTRYKLLETLREFAVDRLAASGRTADVRERFFRHVHELFTKAGEAFDDDPRDEVIAVVATETESRLAALAIAWDGGDAVRGAELLLATECPEGMEDDEARLASRFARALGNERPALRSRLWSRHARNSFVRSFDGAAASNERAVACARESGDHRALANALQTVASIEMRVGNLDRAFAALGEAGTLPLSAGLTYYQAKFDALQTGYAGDYAAAARKFRAMALTERLRGNVNYEFDAYVNHAEAEYAAGNVTRAVEVARDAARLVDGVDRGRRARLNTNYVGYLVDVGDFARARDVARSVVRESRHLVFFGFVLEHLALAHAREGRLVAAAVLHGVSRSAHAAFSSYARAYTEARTLSQLMPFLAAMNVAERERAEGRGASMSRDEAGAFAIGATA